MFCLNIGNFYHSPKFIFDSNYKSMNKFINIIKGSFQLKFVYDFSFKRYSSISFSNLPPKIHEQLKTYQKLKFSEYNHLNKIVVNNTFVDSQTLAKYNNLSSIVEIFNDLELIEDESLYINNHFRNDAEESDLTDLVRVEDEQRKSQRDSLINKLISLLIPYSELDDVNEVSLEILSGAGGQEAMLFAQELLTAYQQYAVTKDWIFECEDCQMSELGGLRSCKYTVSGDNVYKFLKYEAGIHRVQRVPVTSSLGKIHTSTVAVVVLPVESENEFEIKESDLKWELFKSSGPGGQHVNKTESAVRLTHLPTRISVACQNDRLQQLNKKNALKQLSNILYEKHHEERLQAINANKKIIVGSRARSDKIRTYNYQQDRITEHRIHKSWSNIVEIMENGLFEPIIESLQETDFLDQLETALSVTENKSVSL